MSEKRNAFEVLMASTASKKKSTKEPQPQQQPQALRSAFDVLGKTPVGNHGAAGTTKKRKREAAGGKEEDSEEEEFDLEFDEGTRSWKWRWAAVKKMTATATVRQRVEETKKGTVPTISKEEGEAPRVPETTETAATFASKRGLRIIGQAAPMVAAAAAAAAAVPQGTLGEGEKREWCGSARVRHMEEGDGRVSEVKLTSQQRWTRPRWMGVGGKTYHLTVSVLKSLMQKAVRRCMPEAAVRSAVAMMRMDFVEFIRRLTIVMAEDAIVHPLTPVISWLMLASSSKAGASSGSGGEEVKAAEAPPAFEASAEHIEACVRVVWDIASCRFRDVSPKVATEAGAPSRERVEGLKDGKGKSIVKSLLARAAFGGMKGDVNMLVGLANVWVSRVEENESGWMGVVGKAFEGCPAAPRHWEVGDLTPSDAILAAVDFHATPIIDEVLGEGASGEEKERVRTAMWHLRSGVSMKRFVQPELENEESAARIRAELKELWERHSGKFEEWSWTFFAKRWW